MRRASVLAVALSLGCVFGPRPMIPLTDDAGAFNPSAGADAGRGASTDAGTSGVIGADASAPVDVAPFDAPPGGGEADGGSSNFDSHCYPVRSDGGDAGYIDEEGDPCDPTQVRDGGRGDAADASDADATGDGPDGVTRGLR